MYLCIKRVEDRFIYPKLLLEKKMNGHSERKDDYSEFYHW